MPDRATAVRVLCHWHCCRSCYLPRDNERKARREIANSNERRRMQSINAGFQALRKMLQPRDGDKLSKVSHFICIVVVGCYNNNNNMLGYMAPVCQKTSEAPTYVQSADVGGWSITWLSQAKACSKPSAQPFYLGIVNSEWVRFNA